ncbi:MAG: translation initiation factor IF-5A [Candidatus Bathyarchaeota archaeon]|jgi:translation initiation factor 5A
MAIEYQWKIGDCVSKPADVGGLREGGYIVVDGEPCRIVNLTKSKPGKHGSAKAKIVAIGIFDGAKKSFVKPVDANVEVPIIDKRSGQVFSVTSSEIQIMDLETYEYLDAPFPEDKDLKANLNPGVEVEYWQIMGRIKLVRIK